MNRPDNSDESLTLAILSSLDALLVALDLESIGVDRFQARSENTRFDRTFGGQLLAQALVAAGATVEGKVPHSLHAYFVASADTSNVFELEVDRVRDGSSVSTRRVTVLQEDRIVLTAMASFQIASTQPTENDRFSVATSEPEQPRLQDWASRAPAELNRLAEPWIDVPPPIDIRMDEPPSFFGGAKSEEPRTHFLRLPRNVDQSLHAALLVYASDYLLLDMVYRAAPDRYRPEFVGVSLDHSVWLYAPVRLDRWHGYTQELVGLGNGRGLIRGTIRDQNGRLVAQVMQEAVVRPSRP